MRHPPIPYGKITAHLAVVIAASAATAVLCIKGWYLHLVVTLPLLVHSLVQLFRLYGEIVRRLSFIFNAVQNDDYSFRFTENSAQTDYVLVNYALNRIKEVLDNTKMRIREREKYFEHIMECADIGILTVRENGFVAQTNTRALRILGISRMDRIAKLKPLSTELFTAIRDIRPGEQRTVRITTETGEMNLMLGCAETQLNGEILRVISLGNIHEELDRKETEAWEKLTRILTHEIMNSLAPVTSISHMLLDTRCDAARMRQGLETIHTTSERLLRFVGSFRSVTRIPDPQRSPFYLSELISEVLTLTPHTGVEVTVDIDPADTMLYADRSQMSQVLVNLVKNAVEALDEEPGDHRITISSTIDAEERIHIEVTDNGTAIPDEVVENLFTPFFTTKNDGSGIGLAVSRQIVRRHGGTLRLKHNSTGRVGFAIVIE